MKRSEFFYNLPKELIAQTPIEPRDSSRMLVMHKATGELEHKIFRDVTDYLKPGDCLILNNTKVLPARMYGTRVDTGAVVEFLLLTQRSADTWEVITGPGKKAKEGHRFTFGDGSLTAEIIEVLPDGNRVAKFGFEGNFFEVIDKIGEMPLPHYITERLKDKDRYQTVYAKEQGSAAAPTAGLHFTPELLEKIKEKGVRIGFVTLHVGLGTFRPVKADNIEEHHMHSDDGWTDIFIYPGYEFKCIDCLITNFHLPESTLIMLVSAFAGYDHTMHAYEVAVKEKYRFFSFGDAMLIV